MNHNTSSVEATLRDPGLKTQTVRWVRSEKPGGQWQAYLVKEDQLTRLLNLDGYNLPEVFATINQFLAGHLPVHFLEPHRLSH